MQRISKKQNFVFNNQKQILNLCIFETFAYKKLSKSKPLKNG